MVEAGIHVRIPQERVGVLIGHEGRVKRKIEKGLGVEMRVDSATGDIEILLTPETQDPTVIFRAQSAVTAIGRGFSPEKALRLLDESVSLKVIDLRDFFGKSKSDIQRVKGRIIGRNGKTRRIIEELSGADVSIYGYTISIIGEISQLEAARSAVEMLIKGYQHKTVYRFLHKKRRELKKEEMKLWEEAPPKEVFKE